MTQRFEFIEELMRAAAKEHGVEVDENTLPKVARARMLMNVDMQHCPCDLNADLYDENGELNRGCIGKLCMEELKNGKPNKNGERRCHCNCFFTRVENND